MANSFETVKHALTFNNGGMSGGELSFLYDFCKDKQVIELGSMVGQSSYVIASVCKQICCVDAWDDSFAHLAHSAKQQLVYKSDWTDRELGQTMYDTFLDNMRSFMDLGKVQIYQGTTRQAADNFLDESVDILLVDADHEFEGVLEDLTNYLHTVREDGFILCHDYAENDYWWGVKLACDRMVEDGKMIFHSTYERIGVFQKVKQIL